MTTQIHQFSIQIQEGGRLKGSPFVFSSGSHLFGRSPLSPLCCEDPTLSRNHFKIFCKEKVPFLEDCGSKNLTLLNGLPAHGETPLRDGDLICAGGVHFIFSWVKQPRDFYSTTLLEIGQKNKGFAPAAKPLGDFGILGSSPAVEKLRCMLEKISEVDSSLLIFGESGTGKELVASAVHQLSPRKGGPFISLNCAAIPLDLMESELFGHQKGSFTGAILDRKGKFEQAHRGTLFLDEIGDMLPRVQGSLLRAIETKEIQPLGSEKTLSCDVRIIGATHMNLKEAVQMGNFRLDLFYRLNVLSVECPPLRQRIEDIPLLTRYYLGFFSGKYDLSPIEVTPKMIDTLQTYPWPGNVRQLKNYCERWVVLGVLPPLNEGENPAPEGPSTLAPLKELEAWHIQRVLDYVKGNKSKAAQILGIKRSTLYEKIKDYLLK